MIYPPEISNILTELRHSGGESGNAVGSDANFSCGSFVRFRLNIDREQGTVINAGFTSNGCGYMIAAAEIVACEISGKMLADLHGLNDSTFDEPLSGSIGKCPLERANCRKAVLSAVRSAFADFRSRQIEEFCGEKALVCTCFGVTEEYIENAIVTSGLTTIDEVSLRTNAGSGCGSCRMLIQEMLDAAEMG